MQVRTWIFRVVYSISVACFLLAMLAFAEEHDSSRDDEPGFQPSPPHEVSYERWASSATGGYGTIIDVLTELTKLTYSVIIVESNPHASNLFRDRERVSAHCRYNVTSIQFADPEPHDELPSDELPSDELPSVGVGGVPEEELRQVQPFYVGHPVGVDRRVRILHIDDIAHRHDSALTKEQVSHLKAACEDLTERTLSLISDETCRAIALPPRLPTACWANVLRHYPYNAASATMEQRNAYVPLGPRDTFPFVEPARRSLGSERRLFFNLAVTSGTAQRRNHVIAIARAYDEEKDDEFEAFVEGPTLEAEEYQQLLLDSKFTLCPGGHNPETFRMFEALEAGSIPIVSREDYLNPDYMAPHPCGEGEAAWNTVAASPYAQAVSVESWDDLPRLLDDLLSMPEDVLNMLQAACLAWYDLLMARTYESLLNFGDGHDLWPQGGPILAQG